MGAGVVPMVAERRAAAGPLAVAAGALVAGLAVGQGLGSGALGVWGWLTAAGVLAGVGVAGRNRRLRVAAATAALVFAAAGYGLVRSDHLARDDIAHWIPGWSLSGANALGDAAHPEAAAGALPGATLAVVEGVVAGPPHLATPVRGAMGQFAYANPSTLIELEVRAIVESGRPRPASGRLLVDFEQADHRLRSGDRIRVTGWLAGHEPPSNPGERDYRAMLEAMGLRGRLTCPRRGNWTRIEPAPLVSPGSLQRMRERLAAACSASLSLGMTRGEHDGVGADRLALLHALLLGQRRTLPKELTEAFRDVGLSHILSISGAHLGVLVGFAWALAKLMLARPSRAAGVALVVLGLYLAAVPLQTPVVRAAIMTGAYAAAMASGWRVRRLDPLAAAAAIVLIWRPGDVFDAGFQLSFGIVLAMMLFTEPVAAVLTPRVLRELPQDDAGVVLVRLAIGYAAVSVVAFFAALPVVAYHFQVISPWAVALSMLSVLPVIGLLLVGYIKIVAGLVLPSVGLVLAGPLRWLADLTAALVEQARHWPGATFKLVGPPGLTWVVVTLAVVAAVLAGQFRGRPWAASAAAAVCGLWLWLTPMQPPLDAALRDGGDATPTAMTVNMFDVGDGTCLLLRWPGQTLMFDCGSQAYLDVGERSIVPALATLGVRRIDTMVLSHADMDHFCGVLDVVAEVAVERVLAAPQLIEEAASQPMAPAGALLRSLESAGLAPRPIAAGWSERIGDVRIEALWPPEDFDGLRRNDESLVLRLSVAGRRVLLNGDVAREAMPRLIADADLRADVAELPHHGSFIEDLSPRWLAAVRPRVALQSAGKARLRDDPWPDLMAELGVVRLATAQLGMVQLVIRADGTIAWAAMHQPEAQMLRAGSASLFRPARHAPSARPVRAVQLTRPVGLAAPPARPVPSLPATPPPAR